MSRGILVFAAAAAFVFTMYATMASAKKPQYVGNQGCKCHKPEMDEWEKSPHGKAFKMLVAKDRSRDENKAMRDAKLDIKKDYNKDEKCLPCHTVGYGKPGGYEDDKSAKDLVSVGCEMCHGPGSEYRNLHKEKEETFTRAEAKAMGSVSGKEDKAVCMQCHDHKDSPFNSKLDKKYMFNHEETIKLDKAWHKILPLKFKH